MLQIHFTCSSRFESGAFFEDFTFLLQENFWTKMMMVDRLDASFVGDLDVDVASHHHADGGGKEAFAKLESNETKKLLILLKMVNFGRLVQPWRIGFFRLCGSIYKSVYEPSLKLLQILLIHAVFLLIVKRKQLLTTVIPGLQGCPILT